MKYRLGLLVFLAGCAPHVQKKRPKKNIFIEHTTNQEPRSITVFVHGTLPPEFFLQFTFIHNLCCCPKGLIPVKKIDPQYRLRNLQVLHQENPEMFPLQTLYLFGWSGNLNFQERYKTALDLYQALQCLQERHPGLPITIITHSHGGNVALNLARVVDEKQDTTLVIERLILLACPVQKQTSHLVHSPIFKKIHALYSPIDIAQVADPQGLYSENDNKKWPLFSERCFPKNERITHCRIRINGRGMGHIDFLTRTFLKHIPTICTLLEDPKKRALLTPVKGRDEFILRLLDA